VVIYCVGRVKGMYLHMLLHLSDDFDDDLLLNAIRILS
jgi:hypothetical protein